ncbi:Ig-like domain-containing protein, partial [Pseudomonas sp. 10B1]|nr:Ig-like domain-containing protein [Pseudomonas sp. 10B1]
DVYKRQANGGGGGGGGGAAMYTQGMAGIGGHGGSSGNYAGNAGGISTGGNGGAYSGTYLGGRGGTLSAGGIGGPTSVSGGPTNGPYSDYSTGGHGGLASNGTTSIGAGGGGSGFDSTGGAGGSATGGIYNASSGTLKIIGTSVISNNLGAGGGGGGGGGAGPQSVSSNGGAAGKGVGGIWNEGVLLITSANYAAMSANAGGNGAGGPALTGATGASVATVDNNIYTDTAGGATQNLTYAATPSATIAMASSTFRISTNSTVTITFNEAVTGFTNADLTVGNGTLSTVSSVDGGTTWTATFTPNAGVTSSTNHIVLDNTGVQSGSPSTTGIGTSTSASYTIDTVRPTATVVVSNSALNIGGAATVNFTFSEAVSGFTDTDATASNGTLSNFVSTDSSHWSATLTPVLGATRASNVVTLNNALYNDLAGNSGTGLTTSNNYAVDTVRPTALIAVFDNAQNIGSTSEVSITFSEAVTGFTNADLTAADGTLTSVNSADGGITWTATFTPSASVSHTGDVITLNNSGISDTASNAGSGTTTSNTYSVDTVRPTETIVFGNTTLGIGQTSAVTITFSEAVTGFTNADLTVSNGTLSAVTSADRGVTWTATFTPTANIVSTSNHIVLANTDVADLAGNAGSGTTTSNNVDIDGVRPTASIVVANNSIAIGQTSLVTITFSEAVTGFTNADLTISNGTLSSVSSSDGGLTYDATFTPNANITNAAAHITLDNTGCADTAGNIGTGTTLSNSYAIDTQRPTATIALANTSINGGGTSLVTITFSEAVSGFTNADLTIANGTLSNVTSSDSITWTATFTPTAGIVAGTNAVTLANTGVADLAGNAGSGTTSSSNFTIDTVLPTATIVVASNALKIGDTSAVTISFSEMVSGFTNADLTISNGTLSSVSSSDGGLTYDATFTPTTNITNAASHITLDNTGVQAASSGNAGTGTTLSNSYAIDTQRPTASIVVANNNLAIGQNSLVTITFSEAVTSFTNADLTINNGTLSSVSSSDGGVTWTATLTPTAGITQGSNAITLANSGVNDLVGNAGAGTTQSNLYAIDSQRPTAIIVVAHPSLIAGQTSLVTITFSEAVNGFDNSDLSVPNGTLSAVSSSDGGTTWTATLTPTTRIANTSNIISLNNTGVTDLAGNAGNGITSSGNFTVDTVLPTSTIVVANSALNVGHTSTVTITFSEAVSDFSNADLAVANGSLSNVTSGDGGITWTATLTPTSAVTHSSNVIALNNSMVHGASGNAGNGTTASNNYAIDTAPPTSSIVVANSSLAIGQTSAVTITFTEAVTGFNLSDMTVANGALSNLATADSGKTWTATLTPTASLTSASNLIGLDNSRVTDLAGNVGAGITRSNNYVVDGDRPTASIVIANPALTTGQTTLVTFTFSEKVRNFDLSELSVTNGTLSNLVTADGGKTWTATLTPTANIVDPSNVVTLDTGKVSDLLGNAGSGFANSNNYGVTTVSTNGNPLFRSGEPLAAPSLPNVPLQPIIFTSPTGNLGTPLTFAPLFEQRTTGGDLPPVGSIFISNGAPAPSFIAGVFGADSINSSKGAGFLGFGGGEGGVFGNSTLSTLFNHESTTGFSHDAFDIQQTKDQKDTGKGASSFFGAPTLGQQLQQIKDTEQRQIHDLAWALQQVGISEMQA